jgi:hypothetical protein
VEVDLSLSTKIPDFEKQFKNKKELYSFNFIPLASLILA